MVQLLLVVGVMAINDISSAPSSQNDQFGARGDSREAGGIWDRAPAPGVDLPLLSEVPELGKSSALPSPAKSQHPNSVISSLKLIKLWQTAPTPSQENPSLPHSPYSTSVNVI